MAARESHPALRGGLRFKEPMSRHTVWGIGGPAERFFEPADAEDLASFLDSLPDGEALLFIGLGSNLLVRDGGIRGTVVAMGAGLSRLHMADPRTLRAEAGAACPKVARFAVRRRLADCGFFAGIPGTLGGALAMNAGAFGGETWDIVESVETIDRRGHRRRRGRDDFRIGYRQAVGAPGEWFLSADLKLSPDAAGDGAEVVKSLLRLRARTQPVGTRNCGSVFRNPPGDFAARLIEACGLKGASLGGALVSPKHANFIVNTGGARAGDVEALMQVIVDRVAGESGVVLQPEVRIVGEAGPGE